jgi:hypothetical protein
MSPLAVLLDVLTPATPSSQVPWDPYIQHYYADCDLYGRMVSHGHTTQDCNVGMVFNMLVLLDPALSEQLRTWVDDDYECEPA